MRGPLDTPMKNFYIFQIPLDLVHLFLKLFDDTWAYTISAPLRQAVKFTLSLQLQQGAVEKFKNRDEIENLVFDLLKLLAIDELYGEIFQRA